MALAEFMEYGEAPKDTVFRATFAAAASEVLMARGRATPPLPSLDRHGDLVRSWR